MSETNVYSERAILLNFLIPHAEKVHYYIDEEEEAGFEHILCLHIKDEPKTFTWHISDDDLIFLPLKEVYACDTPYYETIEKYTHLWDYIISKEVGK